MRRHTTLLLLFLLVLPILIFRDFTPDNELKYLSIADEALEQGNFFAFYNHGAPYADKPPLYLWIVMGGKLLFGKHIMLFLSLFSIIPSLIIIAVMERWCKLNGIGGTTATSGVGSWLLFTSAFFLASSVVLRMDMLMTMFIVLALFTFYKIYLLKGENIESDIAQKRRRGLQIHFPIYIFMAIFSKGAIGFLVPIISIIIFLIVERQLKEWRTYLGWKTWSILGGLSLLWFIGVYLDGGKEYLNNLLFNQTINRAIDSFHHKEPFWYYGITYWYAIAPWSILVFIVISTAYFKRLVKTKLERFFAIITFSTLIMLSLISSKIVIYLLPCIPFMIYLTALLLPKVKDYWYVKLGVLIPALIFICSFIFASILEFLPDICKIFSYNFDTLPPIIIEIYLFSKNLSLIFPLYILTAILAAAGILTLFLGKSELERGIKILSGGLLIFIFVSSFSLPTLNNMIGLRQGAKMAFNMVERGNYSIAYYDFKAGKNLDVYFKEFMKQNGKRSKEEIKKFEVKQLLQNELSSLKNCILFVKTKDFGRDTVLNNTLGSLPRYNYGEFSLILIP